MDGQHQQRESRRMRADPDLWHEGDRPMQMGCLNCPEQALCGGLNVAAGIFDCLDLCKCTGPETCTNVVCPRNSSHFVARVREVGGFHFDIPASPGTEECPLPTYIPLLYGRSKRVGQLTTPAVAVPLHNLFHSRTGDLRFQTRSSLAKHFRFSPETRLVITGVAEDRQLEAYWSAGRAAHVSEALRQLSPDLVTSPNFSSFSDVPRWDNLQNMKRIALCWHELASAGIPTALHVNARTDRDWDRWIELLVAHPEIATIAFEFGTGAAARSRGEWHAEKLRYVRDRVGRPLRLVIKGGLAFLRILRISGASIVFVDSSAYMRTMKRRALVRSSAGRLRWRRTPTMVETPLDNLLQLNVMNAERHVHDLLFRPLQPVTLQQMPLFANLGHLARAESVGL